MLNRVFVPVLLSLLAAGMLVGSLHAQQSLIPHAALVDMSRAHTRVICTSESYLACMNIDAEQCVSLSEAAIDQCLMKLPAEVDPTRIDNDMLEACPQQVYEEAGYSEAKAKVCFENAIEDAAEDESDDEG